MKRLIALVMAMAMILPAACLADLPDLSGLTFEELVDLRGQVNLVLMASGEYQEVEVPAGVWEIGKDIPAGHWAVAVSPKDYTQIYYCKELDETGMFESFDAPHWSALLFGEKSSFPDRGPSQIDIQMEEGWHFINTISVTFKTYTGKPDLGFK